MRVFLPADHAPMPGEIFRQPDLARTLRSMAEAEKKALASGASRAAAIDAVRDYFYRGDIAHRIDAFSRQNQGLLRYELRHVRVRSTIQRPVVAFNVSLSQRQQPCDSQ